MKDLAYFILLAVFSFLLVWAFFNPGMDIVLNL